MKNLKVGQKLALIGFVFMLPLLGVAFLLATRLNDGIAFRNREISGVKVASSLLDLVREFEALRAVRNAALRTTGLEPEVARRTAKLQQLIDEFGDRTDHHFSASEWRLLVPRTDAMPVHDLPERSWQQTRDEVLRYLHRPLTGAPLDDFDVANEAIDALLALVRDIGDRSNLTLDPHLDSFYLQHVLLVEGPLAIEQLSRARALGVGLVWPGEDRAEVDATMRVMLTLSTPDRERDRPLANHRLGPVQQERGETAIDRARREPAARVAMEELRLKLAGVSARSREELMLALAGHAPAVPPTEFPPYVEKRLDEGYGLKSAVEATLREVLSTRLKRLRDDRSLAIIFSGVGVLAVAGLGMLLMRDITGPISRLARVAREIAEGHADANVTIPHRGDEIGDLAEAFQRMLTEERRQREALVENNVKLLEATERALDADRAKRDFLAAMSHEIRTPLNGILPVAELIGDTQLDDVQREYVRTIRSSAEHLLTLVDDVLDFSKIEAGRLELEQAHFELREVLGDAVQTLAARAASRGLELTFHVRPDVPSNVIGDAHRLRQIIVNLMGNALKFTHEGEVSLLVECASPPSDEHADLRFQVHDTGIGIAPDVIPKLFSAFEQADNSTTRQYGGSGLGLAISKRLVDLMGGTIHVESRVDEGSTFSFTARFGLTEVDYEMTVWNDLPRVKVLSVDDNATNRMIVRDLLHSWGLRTEEAERADEGLRKLQAAHAAGAPFELVITDMMMPDKDGFGFVADIRADPELRDTKVMMLTSAARPGDANRIRELGFSAVLNKPIRQAQLMDTIAVVFGRQRRSRHTARIDPKQIPAQRPLRILLAEDNATNQHVARMNLESWGHRVITAADGVEAVNRFGEGGIDLILMDSQMPNMNGLEATAAIRKRETEGQHVAIIAMTANVVKGFRDECIVAGMDGYVSKPLRREALVEEMARVIPDLLVAGESIMPESPRLPELETSAAPVAILDERALLETAGGDTAMLHQMVEITLQEDVPRLNGSLTALSVDSDPGEIESVAHAIKGLAAELRAEACRAAAERLELAAKDQRGDALLSGIADLQSEFTRLIEILRTL